MRCYTFSFITSAGKIAEFSKDEKWGETSLQPCFQFKTPIKLNVVLKRVNWNQYRFQVYVEAIKEPYLWE